MAQFTHHRKNYCLGYFHDEQGAARAYDRAVYQAWGFGCWLNFPDEFR